MPGAPPAALERSLKDVRPARRCLGSLPCESPPNDGTHGAPRVLHPMQKHEQRRDRLVRPRLQLRLILAFLAVATTALLLQFALFASVLSGAAAELPQDGSLLLERTTSLSVTILVVSLGVLLPLCFFVGVLVTFRVAGPLYRFEKHLEAIAHGSDPGPCRIRSGDELQDFCATLNRALDRMRARGAFSQARDPIGTSEPAGTPQPVGSMDEAA